MDTTGNTKTKDISQYLHLYLGCDWQWEQQSGIFPSGIYGTDLFNSLLLKEVALKNGRAKPIIRPLSSMTEDEKTWLLILHYTPLKVFIVSIEFKDEKFHPKIQNHQSISYKATVKHEEKESTMMGTISFSSLNPSQFHNLLSKGFDLFGLIEAGLAIDSTKQED